MPDSVPRGRSWHGVTDAILRPVETAAAIAGGAVMLLAMVLTSLDAILRYAANKPLSFNLFFTENYLMVALICLPLAWAFRNGGYIRIKFLYDRLPTRYADLLIRAGLLAGFLLIADLAWLAGHQWHKAYTTNEIVMDVLDWPMHLSWIWVPIGLGLLAIRLLMTALGPRDQLLFQHDIEEEGL